LHLVRAFDSSPDFDWNTSGLAPGIYTVTVWANQQGASTAASEASASSQVTLTGCTAASLAPGIAAGEAGTHIVLNATSNGCVAQYEFRVNKTGGPTQIIQTFGINPTFDWNTSGLSPGTYTAEVWANQVGASTTASEASAISTVTLTGCATVTAIGSPSSPQRPGLSGRDFGAPPLPRGTVLTVYASSTGCANPIYELRVMDPNKVWHVVWNFTDGLVTTFPLDTTRWQEGTWTFEVWGNSLNSDYTHAQAFGVVTRTLT
jgi:hypothetical protein